MLLCARFSQRTQIEMKDGMEKIFYRTLPLLLAVALGGLSGCRRPTADPEPVSPPEAVQPVEPSQPEPIEPPTPPEPRPKPEFEPPSDHPLSQFTGRRTRVVWCRQVVGMGDDPFAEGPNFILVGLDTHDGLGERVILGDVDNYSKPLLSPDGETVVFTHHPTHRIYAVDWDGSNRRLLAEGLALDLWRDLDDGTTWLIYGERRPDHEHKNAGPVYRRRLDQPKVRKLLWSRTDITADNFQLSRDGQRAGGLFPWNHAGVADLQQHTWRRSGRGCWTSFSPDNSYMLWIFDGAHKNVYLHPYGGGPARKVRLNSAPGTEPYEIYHPRWSNHVRYLAISGPYRIMDRHNAITGGGEGINLYVGRFDEAFTRVEDWVQITDIAEADFFPDVWIEGGEFSDADKPEAPPPPDDIQVEEGQWPTSTEGLVYLWDNAASMNEVPDGEGGLREIQTVRRGHALLGRFFEADLLGGWMEAPGFDAWFAEALRATDAFTLELTLTRAGQHRPAFSVILAMARDADQGNLLLMEKRGEVYLRLLTDESPFDLLRDVHLFRLHPVAPTRVAITYEAGALSWFLNGAPALSYHDVRGGFGPWLPFPFTLGALPEGGADWPGFVEGVAIYNRALTPGEIAANDRARAEQMAARAPGERIHFTGRLLEKTPTPTPESIEPYRAGLVEYLYEVESVEHGELDAPRVIVQHWGVLDGAEVPLAFEMGESYALQIEPVDQRPELEGERVSSQVSDLTAPLFLEVR